MHVVGVETEGRGIDQKTGSVIDETRIARGAKVAKGKEVVAGKRREAGARKDTIVVEAGTVTGSLGLDLGIEGVGLPLGLEVEQLEEDLLGTPRLPKKSHHLKYSLLQKRETLGQYLSCSFPKEFALGT